MTRQSAKEPRSGELCVHTGEAADNECVAIGGGYDRCGAPTVRGKQHSGPPVYIAAAVLFCGKT